MNESHMTACIGSVMQFIVAGYALRLNRRFGTARVGWSLFGAFSLLAVLQLIQSMSAFDAGANSALMINVTYVLISFLLLIGMLHLETMLKERFRLERVEQRLRVNLETEVTSKTAHLTRAIEELMFEMEESKRMAAIIESAEWTTMNKTVEDLPETTSQPTLASFLPEHDDDQKQILSGILSGELAAHF